MPTTTAPVAAPAAGPERITDSELSEARVRYRRWFDYAPIGQALVGLDGSLRAGNLALCRLLGMGADELCRLTVEDVTHPDDLDLDRAQREALLAGSLDSYSTEKRYVRPGGQIVWAHEHVSLFRDNAGPRCYVYQVEDVTERHLREEELRQISEELSWVNRALQENITKALANEARYRALVDHLPDTVAYVLNRDGRIVTAGGGGSMPGGADEESVVGRTLGDLFHRDDAAELRRLVASVFDGQAVSTELILHTLGRDYLIDAVPLEPQRGGQATEALMLARDISGRKERERALAEAGTRWQAAFEEAPVPMVEVGIDGVVLRANRAMGGLVRSPDLEGRSLIDWLHADERASASELFRRVVATGAVDAASDLRFVADDGSVRLVAARGAMLRGVGGSPDRMLVHLLDVTAAREQRSKVEAAHARFSALIEHSSDVTTITDAERVVVYASPAYESLTGRRVEEALGRDVSELVHPDDLERVQMVLRSLASAPGAVTRYSCRLHHADGGWRHVEVVATNRLHDAAVGGIVANARDVTERVEAANRLAHQAMHDSLTNLPNRALLLHRLSEALARAAASGQPCALLFVDLDRFKGINDSLGHAAGDRLLVAVAERFQRVIRPGDSVARLGGDEFVVLAESVTSPRVAVQIAERIRDSLRQPIQLGDRNLTVGCSVGIALSERHSADALLQEADTALFQAKERGRDRWELYDHATRTRARRRLTTESLIRTGLDSGGLLVLHQPIVDLSTGEVGSTEALARLQEPNGRILGAGEFISVAEDSELIVVLGAAILDLACAQQARWSAAGAGPAGVSVNLSARQLLSPSLVAHVAETLDNHGLRASQLCLEITESALIETGPIMGRSIDQLKAMGVSLAIDDFGTGWSSLTYLRRFPVDVVKIDHGFVSGLGVDEEDTEVVRAIIGLGHALGLTTVAEGVENALQESVLRRLGCDFAQGHRYGPPQRPERLRFDDVRLGAQEATG